MSNFKSNANALRKYADFEHRFMYNIQMELDMGQGMYYFKYLKRKTVNFQ